MATKSAKSQEPGSAITAEQWDMPVSFDLDGRPISLREYAEGGRPAASFNSLNDDQRAELAEKRISMQHAYEMGTIGASVVSKERALDEVRRRTKLGRRLVQIEMRVIVYLIDEATKHANKGS
jgi:hypothetical protein